ncbi:hypothetical protein ACFRR7_02895 [Streptomyces sp. NPDC056909]|uniref:hypothetical protein n=1 Tax=Streptomyces sp. NPDC056909 TaxID=3345963 RepID=UPI0036B00B9E
MGDEADGDRDDERAAAGGSQEDSALEEELRALGRGMRIPDVDGETMAERVLAQLLAEAVPVPVPGSGTGAGTGTGAVPEPPGPPGPPGRSARVRRWLRERWRRVAAGLSGLLVVLVLTPPVRAAVADWFDFGGVEVRYDPSAGPRTPPATPSAVPAPGCHRPVTIAEAARRAGFTPRVPAELGDPDVVSLAETSPGRSVVSLCWTERGRTIRLDEFPATLDIGFVKQVSVLPEWLSLRDGTTGLWFGKPHLLRFRLIGGDGEGWSESVRPAGPTLLWQHGDRLTLRLEGVTSVARAEAIAESVRGDGGSPR